MKHMPLIAALVIAVFTVSSISAQETQTEKESVLTGVWQVCFPQSNFAEAGIKTGSYLKILSKNGELTNMTISTGSQSSVMTATGTYNQTSDSTYVESIEFSIDASLRGKDNQLKYKLVDNKYLYLEFYVGEIPTPFTECWVRISAPTAAQMARRSTSIPKQREDGAYMAPDVLPSFKGGQTAMMQYISKNLKYPEEAQKRGLKGVVLVQFVVDAEGNVTVPKVLRGIDPLLDNEALKVISTMPRWIPGTDKGVAVPVVYTIPINFNLSATPKSKPLVAAL